MKSSWGRAGLATIALCIAMPVYAGVSQDFSECDGLKKPKRSDDGMRGEATMPAYQFGSRTAPNRTVAACDRALASGKLLSEQTLRLAHVMRARGAAKLQLGDAVAALADFESAKTAGESNAGEFFYDRSMGVSIDLLRAIALNEIGQRDEALAIAEAAATKRAFSLEIQRVSAMLRAANGDNPAEQDIWKDIVRIDPAIRGLTAQLASKSDDLDALAASAGIPSVTLPDPPSLSAIMANKGDVTRLVSSWTDQVNNALIKAYALAANGQPDAARAWVQATGDALDAAAPAQQTESQGSEKNANSITTLLAKMARADSFAPLSNLIEARIAISEGRLTNAASALEGQKLRSAPVTEEFYAAYAAARAAGSSNAPTLPELAPSAERSPARLARMAPALLIRPESKRALIDYQKSRPNILGAMVGAAFSMGTSLLGGIDRTAGFRSTENENGSIKVEYTGNTSSGPVVQEMTLLRAAELTREAGKTHFEIVSRNDYQRYLTQLINGVPTSRTLAGYKTEMTIRLTSEAESEAEALDAIAVIDTLGPVYYEG